MQEKLKLINMQTVQVEKVHWLWYPYIPYGKITIVQGDPGDGKTTMILAVAAAVTTGSPLPGMDGAGVPASVIYQTAEDGLGDTVKPRLLDAGADCGRVLVIDESEQELTLSDSRISEAIAATGARLFILDPLQAYLGAGVDMHRANEVRPVFKRLSLVAEQSGCAVVIVGHMNKGGAKSQYRGLGSIDIPAAARSVLTLGRIPGKPTLRAFAQGKSNLAPEGAAIAFDLDPAAGFRWIGEYPITIDQLLDGTFKERDTLVDRAKKLLEDELSTGPLAASRAFALAAEQGISPRTLKRAKSELGIQTYKQGNHWFWSYQHEPL